MKRTFDNPVNIGHGLMVAMLLLNAGLTYWHIRQLSQDAAGVAHSHEVQNLTSDVMLTIVDAETGQRGFVITGKDEFLQPYDAALARLEGVIAKLKDKTKDNSGQQARIKTLEELIAVRLAQMKEVIGLQRQDEKAARAFVLTGKPMAQMDAIRQHVADMKKVDDDLLREQQSMTATTYRVAVTTGLLTAVFGLVTVGAFVWLVRRSVSAREQAAAVLYEERERFRLTLASIGDGVIATDTEGSEFVIHLPVLREVLESATANPATTSSETKSASALRVLVVDDNVDAANSLEMLLEMSGYRTQTANDGIQAIEAASVFHPDVVLLDIGLPKLNGHEVARRIRAEPWGQTMALIALTGWGQDADRQRTQEAGFNAHLVKPVNLQLLEKMLQETRTKAEMS